MHSVVGNGEKVTLDYNNSRLKVVGNNCVVKVTTNHCDIEVIGNDCKVEIGENNTSRLKVTGNNCILKVTTNHGDIEVIGNNCKVEIGENHGSCSLDGVNGLVYIRKRFPGDRVFLNGPGTHMVVNGQMKTSECDTQLSSFTKDLDDGIESVSLSDQRNFKSGV